MIKKLQDFARQEILDGLSQLPEANQYLFKRGYSHGNCDRSIAEIVADMPEDRLQGALQLVERTLKDRGGDK